MSQFYYFCESEYLDLSLETVFYPICIHKVSMNYLANVQIKRKRKGEHFNSLFARSHSIIFIALG